MSSLYHSTRNMSKSVTSKQAILAGLAADGGLYVSDALTNKNADDPIDLTAICHEDYHGIALTILSRLLSDYSQDEIEHCIEAAYGPRFDTSAITPLVPLGNDWLLELWHGPTCAFKDVALQMLPRLMAVARKDAGTADNVMIVCATSGDTGKAALEGFANVEGTGVTVFYPAGGVSDIQHLQMVTQRGENVSVCGINGNFDDAQTQVKRIFSDPMLKERLADEKIVLSSANSINVGRLCTTGRLRLLRRCPTRRGWFDQYRRGSGILRTNRKLRGCAGRLLCQITRLTCRSPHCCLKR